VQKWTFTAWRTFSCYWRILAKKAGPKLFSPRMNQEHLAQMVGTTRSRVSHFMTKFKKLGFIDYANGLTVHSGLLSVVLND